MTVTFVSGSASANSNTALTTVIVNPTGEVVAGNLLITFVYAKSTASSPGFTAPSGWNLAGQIIGQAQGGMAIWTKIASAAEPGPTFGGPGGLAAVFLQYSGASGVDGGPRFATGTGTTATSPSLGAPSADDRLVLGYGSFGGNTWSAPTGTTARTAARSIGNESIFTFDAALAAAGPTPTYSATQTSAGWIAASILLGTPNTAPTADAGPDQSVAAGATVTLTGTDSDPENNIVTRAWSQLSGPTVTLTGSGATRTFTAPSLATASTLVFTYTVTDAGGLSASDTVTINVAKATVDRLRLGASTVALRLGDQPVSKVYLGTTLVWP